MGESKMTGLERLRELAEAIKQGRRCVILHRHFGDGPTGCRNRHRRCGECEGDFLVDLSDQIESETAHDHSKDVSMSAYDLLPDCDREAISLALDCGGAEEIKKRLMPEGMEWPKVDGKPVDFKTAYGPSLGVLEAVSIYNTGACQVMSHDGIVKSAKDIHIVKPKVLDADGVEIRVGDTVYAPQYCYVRCTVMEIDFETYGYLVEVENEGGHKFRQTPDVFTHRAPVFAADGKPLREGETVWGVTGASYRITGAHDGGVFARHVNGSFGAEVKTAGGEGLYQLRADKLTHERPDSWERIEEDAKLAPGDYIEKHGRKTDLYAYKEMPIDLVRRAKKLAGVS